MLASSVVITRRPIPSPGHDWTFDQQTRGRLIAGGINPDLPLEMTERSELAFREPQVIYSIDFYQELTPEQEFFPPVYGTSRLSEAYSAFRDLDALQRPLQNR